MASSGGARRTLIARARGEYAEMPDLRLTTQQAARLWGLDAATSHAILDALVDAEFLCRMPSGAYRRADDRSRP